MVVANALTKARAVAAGLSSGDDAIVIGADTEVVIDGRVLGKPASANEAREYISLLAGRDHQVHSGVAVIGPGRRELTAVESTTVRFRALAAAEIDDYVATGEWRERSGGYAIQMGAASLVERIVGDERNVVGLPVDRLLELAPELRVR